MAAKIVTTEFTSWELAQIVAIVGNQTGSPAAMRRWWRILDAIEPDDDMKEELGWVYVNPSVYAVDDSMADELIEVELHKTDHQGIIDAVSGFNNWRAGGVAGGDRDRIEALFDKLGI